MKRKEKKLGAVGFWCVMNACNRSMVSILPVLFLRGSVIIAEEPCCSAYSCMIYPVYEAHGIKYMID